MDSRVADHCGRYALSDSEKTEFSSNCQHNHDLRCDVCENAKNLFGDIRDRARFLIEKAGDELKAASKHSKKYEHKKPQKLIFQIRIKTSKSWKS